MEAAHKRILRPLSLALRHELEGWRDEETGQWHPGDLDRRLAELGIHREKSKPLDEMPHLSGDDRRARVVVDGYLQLRADAGIERDIAVAEFVRESAYTWANRLLALRCMEARSIIEEVILQKAAYAGRSLVHQRFLRKAPDAAAGADDGLFAVLFAEFAARAAELPALFDPQAAAIALRPSVAALKRCVALLSGTETMRGQEPATDAVFMAPDAFGWAYQYWNTEEKDRVFDAVRPPRRKKIEGADIVPATQLYTEPYMVKFLVQNSLGVLWMSLHPDSRLCDDWKYYVRDANRAPVETSTELRSVRDFTFLDPALGSGHFHLEAFDLFFAMYREENPALTPREIAASILNRNLFGIDLDERAVQIAEAALWMKAKDAAPDLEAADLDTFHDHLVATNIRLPRGRDTLETFLRQHPEDAPLRPALELVFRGLEHADELGSLLQIEEPMDRELRRLKAEADAVGATPPVQPDMFRATAVQSALPIGIENYQAWKAGALDRLKTHFEQEAEAADSLRAFFGISARKGLALFDLLARRYDIVAANPPYMGSRNMGGVLKTLVERNYPAGKRDLYAAFILRCLSLVKQHGAIAMVTMNKWLHARAYAPLRCGRDLSSAGVEKGDRRPDNLLWSNRVDALADLGSRAFDPDNKFHDGVQVALFVVRHTEPDADSAIPLIDCTAPDGPIEKSRALVAAITRGTYSKTLQHRFAELPGAPVCYRLSEHLLRTLKVTPVFGESARARQGICTTADPRFVRMVWEVTLNQRWFVFAKGGGHRRWDGLRQYAVDWEDDGTRIKTFITDTPHAIHWSGRMPEADYYFKAGWCFSRIAFGSFGARCFRASDLFGHTNPAILFRHQVSPEDALACAGLLNSPTTTYVLRAITQSNDFTEGYLRRLPFPLPVSRVAEAAAVAASIALAAAQEISAGDITEATFGGLQGAAPSLLETIRATLNDRLTRELIVSVAERVLQRVSYAQWNLPEIDIVRLEEVMGFASIPDHDPSGAVPDELFSKAASFFGPDALERGSADTTAELVASALDHLSGVQPESADTEDEESKDEEEDDEISSASPMPPFGVVDQFARAAGIGIGSAYVALKSAAGQLGATTKRSSRLTEDRFTVLVLRMLGHRWPIQVEAGEPLPDWADRDGVIPLFSGSSEPTLAARVLERLGGEFPGGSPVAIRAEFEQIVGMSLETWLAGGFFARHIPQFKKRPIAWQIQSQPAAQPGRRRTSTASKPMFACLVYYRRLDTDLLPKLRSHYLAVLRTAHETELRTLEALAQPTPDQGARKAELEVLVDELNRFDAQLQAVVETGFCPAPFQPRLRQLAVDDAMLAMKARWLARLRETLQAAPLAEWQTAATALGHHAEFPRWIAEAIAHLPHHCSKAGAQSPDAEKLPEDPTPISLAAVICAETDRMTATALDFVCAEWMHEWDTHVVDPLRTRIAAANDALDTLAGELETLDRRNTTRVEEIAREQKRLRAEVKSLKAEIKTKTEKAGQLAASIRKWTSPELAKWESWLASGPLFDEVSTLDGHRAAPVTIRDFVQQESFYAPDLNDGVRVNIAPLQRAGLLPADVIAGKDVDKAIADRAEWRADERRWVREGKLPQCGWWEKNL